MRNAIFRAALIAAAIIIAAMTIAGADENPLGWADFYKDCGEEDRALTGAAQSVMDAAGETVFSLGDLQFTVGGLYCDGRVTMATATIRRLDGSGALFCASPNHTLFAYGEHGQALAAQLGLDDRATWLDAARQLNLPLYAVGVWQELPDGLYTGEGLRDFLMNPDGSLVCYDMAFMTGRSSDTTVSAEMFLQAARIDPVSGIKTDALTAREPLSLHLETPSASCQFTFEDGQTDAFELLGVRGELLPAGLYLYASVSVPEDTALPGKYDIDLIQWLQPDGTPYPTGVGLSRGVDADGFPVLVFDSLIPMEEIPRDMILSLWGERIRITR